MTKYIRDSPLMKNKMTLTATSRNEIIFLEVRTKMRTTEKKSPLNIPHGEHGHTTNKRGTWIYLTFDDAGFKPQPSILLGTHHTHCPTTTRYHLFDCSLKHIVKYTTGPQLTKENTRDQLTTRLVIGQATTFS